MDEKRGFTPAMLHAQALGRGPTAGTPEAILASEAAGQQQLVNGTSLPKESRPPWEEVVKHVRLIIDDVVDDIFVSVTLPDGWTKKPTSHNMWSELYDDKGRLRASMFYKAAFYDRKAHMSWERFIYVSSDYESPDVVVSNRDGEVLHAFRGEDGERMDNREKAWAWIDENYPDRNPFAYWT